MFIQALFLICLNGLFFQGYICFQFFDTVSCMIFIFVVENLWEGHFCRAKTWMLQMELNQEGVKSTSKRSNHAKPTHTDDFCTEKQLKKTQHRGQQTTKYQHNSLVQLTTELIRCAAILQFSKHCSAAVCFGFRRGPSCSKEMAPLM